MISVNQGIMYQGIPETQSCNRNVPNCWITQSGYQECENWASTAVFNWWNLWITNNQQFSLKNYPKIFWEKQTTTV